MDDGLSIYYRKDKVELVGPMETVITQSTKNDETLQTTNGKSYYTWRFRKVNSSNCGFKVTVAHLKSGETCKGAHSRMEEMHAMMLDTNVNDSVILMDSNCSRHYPDGTGIEAPNPFADTDMNDSVTLMNCSCPDGTDIVAPNPFADTGKLKKYQEEQKGIEDFRNIQKKLGLATTPAIFQRAGYVDLVPDEGNECFKMRHARGGQPAKFCEFMFDRIDRILVPLHKTQGPARFLPIHKRMDMETYTTLLKMRQIDHERKQLKEACLPVNKIDKPGWIVPTGKYEEILKDLYPSTDLPSDHPPVAARVTVVCGNSSETTSRV
jgi:hypothetical protein